MNRKQGIIKNWQITNKSQEQPPEEIFHQEYVNYVENCAYCYEQPMKLDDWLNQSINPLKP